jgi:membrane protein
MQGVLKLVVWILLLKILLAEWRSGKRARPARAVRGAGTEVTTRPSGPAIGARGGTETGTPTGSGEGDVETPLDLEAPDWKATVKRTLTEIKDDRVPLVAAGMGYYFFLAIFPALIALISIMSLFDLDSSGIVRSIETTMPGDSGEAITEAFRQADKPSSSTPLTATILGIGLALWSASSGMVALQSGLNVAYDVGRDRKFFGKRAIALLLLVVTALLGGVPSPVFTFGESTIFVVLGWILTIAAVIVLFSVFYYLGPNRESPRWQWVSVGGVVGAVLWIVASLIFGYYVDNYSNYAKTYGFLAGAIVLILWLYLSSLAVLVGGELNAELEHQAEARARRN